MSEEAPPVAGPPQSLAAGIIKAVRPRQWVKNLLVLAAPLAALGDEIDYDYREVLLRVGVAFVAFCLAASCIYLINDSRDVEADRAHPTKRFRPIAAGVVPVSLAYGLAAVLGVASLAISWLVTPHLAVVMAVYLAIQLAYCFGLKHQAVLDICIVSSGFLIRAIAGGVAAGIPLSQWFLLVFAFGSLFMAAGKRYAELQLAERTGAKIRKSLERYTSSYLRFVWTLAATAVVLCYALFAFMKDYRILRRFSYVSMVIGLALLLSTPCSPSSATADRRAGGRSRSSRSPSRSCATRWTSTAATPANPRRSRCTTGCCSCWPWH